MLQPSHAELFSLRGIYLKIVTIGTYLAWLIQIFFTCGNFIQHPVAYPQVSIRILPLASFRPAAPTSTDTLPINKAGTATPTPRPDSPVIRPELLPGKSASIRSMAARMIIAG